MTVSVMVTGSLAKQPTRRTSKNGNAYLTASLRVTAGNETEWWNLLCFNEGGQAEITRLDVGEKLSCQGTLKLELYRTSDGEPKISARLSLTACWHSANLRANASRGSRRPVHPMASHKVVPRMTEGRTMRSLSNDERISRARAADIADIASRVGARLKRVTTTEWAGPCPACGGTDRFSINVKRADF